VLISSCYRTDVGERRGAGAGRIVGEKRNGCREGERDEGEDSQQAWRAPASQKESTTHRERHGSPA
jgi:hypothetical protein